MTRYIRLIGYPIRHSISPYFQQAALDYYRLDIRYEVWETSPDELGRVVNKLREAENVGANVTVPHKEAVLPLLDEVDSLASIIGAVNTIVKKDGKLVGFNTDAYGFLQALEREGHFDAAGKRVVMLGAGGVAKAVGFVLIQKRIASLGIIGRTFDKAEALAANLGRHAEVASSGVGKVKAFEWRAVNCADTFRNCDLIVHCTTIGMKDGPQEGQSPLKLEVIPENVLVYDVVYNPLLTPLLELAQKAGANILGGLPMLVYQGAASFELWTGKSAPIDIMFSKAKEALTGGKP